MSIRWLLTGLLGALLLTTAGRAEEGKDIVEISTPQPPPPDGTLGTILYAPTKLEAARTKGWSAGELASGGVSARSLPALGGKRVAWFGIVREVTEDREKGKTELLVEMKYFDGLTDTHLQIVSIYGAGDFRAIVPGIDHKIKKLSLVRVCGKVEPKPGDVPTVEADYVRVWYWGLFAFMDYGEDKSNPKWVKLRKNKADDVYSSAPDRSYYEERLGKR
jgi:hypothetical protein